ncbi:hypothetical protein B0F90DRAFT_129062 [Multifurca ochricompacta]|uniref:Conserved oligomeric Golgi complex subunit 1 n=1 Tax=Multifurca ochricompacta TaxID=376703 RepID=A0AAD4MD27_9AGAM|nr:hypothetical protein B0F90DRAFT_129062 [Multifurca ochricompacta]
MAASREEKYLHAGWLFLLARIIYQALARDDTEDEDDWTAHGIDVLEQFPLVQRQWDTVAQFRAQITYKATLSLRDSSSSLEDVCSILLTLHLLESRPLIDVLTIFLAQRARSLQAILSRSTKSAPNGSSSLNGGAFPKSKKAITREVREGLEGVLDAIASTVDVARGVFCDRSHEDPSLLSRVLLFIQSDVPVTDTALPPQLQMSTQHLLYTLPSASHFALLPSNIRSYKPYVDLASAMSSLSSTQVTLRLSEWFSKAVTDLRRVAEGWFAELRTLKDVWAVRSWFNDWLRAKKLEDREGQELAEVIGDISHGQALKILRTALSDLQDGFRDELQHALLQLRDGANEAFVESNPAKFLFQPLAPPSLDVGMGSSLISAFRKYESTLQRQVTSRTPLLHKIVCSLENDAEALQEDAEGKLTENLRAAYVPLAEDCCKSVLASISSNIVKLTSGSDADVRSLAFLSRLTEALHASPFRSYLKCQAENFRGDMSELHEQSVNQWRIFVVSAALTNYQKTCQPLRSQGNSNAQPSWSLMQALLSLSSSVHSIEASANPIRLRSRSIAEITLRHFTASLTNAVTPDRGAQKSDVIHKQ